MLPVIYVFASLQHWFFQSFSCDCWSLSANKQYTWVKRKRVDQSRKRVKHRERDSVLIRLNKHCFAVAWVAQRIYVIMFIIWITDDIVGSLIFLWLWFMQLIREFLICFLHSRLIVDLLYNEDSSLLRLARRRDQWM